MPLRIHILPDDLFLEANSGESLLSVLIKANIDLHLPCAGNASCGKCLVRFTTNPPQPDPRELSIIPLAKLRRGFRLACCAKLSADARIEIPEMSRLRTLRVKSTTRQQAAERLNPSLLKIYLELEPASIKNPQSDLDILLSALQKKLPGRSFRPDPAFIEKLPIVLREAKYHFTVVIFEDELIQLQPGDTTAHLFGIAVDCGTTSLAAGLVDLVSGQTLTVQRMSNPQAVFGADLISRIVKASVSSEQFSSVRKKMLDGINRLVKELCRTHCADTENVFTVIVAGNAAMNHFLWKVPLETLARTPYTPVFSQALVHSNAGILSALPAAAKLTTLPNAGGFVGGDLAADLLVAGMKRKENNLLLDLGTNCEIALHFNGRTLLTSAPAGPALEGASIACGMQAVPGAIDDIYLNEKGTPVLHTIENQAAAGICGSGLFHIMYFLRQYELIDTGGLFQFPQIKENLPPEQENWFKERFEMTASQVLQLNLSKGKKVYLSQKDIREFQLARAAIISAWKLLFTETGCSAEALNSVYIAGTFGNFIRPEVLLYLGLIPQVALEKVHFLGNAALEGARLTLTNRANLKKIIKLIKNAEFRELAGRPDFQDMFFEQLNF